MEIKKLILGRIDNNTYIISKGKECIVIDPSMEYPKIIEYIRENGLEVKGILLTHSHYDHVYSLFELVRDTGAPVYMHQNDLGMYDFSVKKLRTEKVEINHILKGGEVLDIMGEKIEVLHFPGHTMGCVCYIIGESMFTGDFIFKGCVGRTDFECSSPKDMEESLNRFVKLDRRLTIYAGHGDDTTFDYELETNPYLSGRV